MILMQSDDVLTDNDALWDTVNRREPGDFLYAVTTMGVFCRPTCPSPRPLRRNVRFFDTPADAEAAGFRACKRCDPKGERARIAEAVVRDACAHIEAEDTIPSLDALAARSGYSRFHFLRMFRDHTGLTPRGYAEGVRTRRLQAALADGARVADAVAGAGYGSESRVYEKTGALLGMTPGALRRGGAGEEIRTAFADCPFGRLLVGATDKGVCFLGFAEPEEALLGDLRRRFPRARLRRRRRRVAGRDPRRARLHRGAEPGARPAARPARHRVPAARLAGAWAAFPAGETRSYAELAAMIDAPARGAGRRPVLRHQPGAARGAMPSRDRQRRQPDRLPLGGGAQARTARGRAGGGRPSLNCPPPATYLPLSPPILFGG